MTTVVSWTVIEILHVGYVSGDQTISATVYYSQIENFFHRKPFLVSIKRVLLPHDNGRPHVPLETERKIQNIKWEFLPQPPYAPVIFSCDCYIFLSLSNNPFVV